VAPGVSPQVLALLGQELTALTDDIGQVVERGEVARGHCLVAPGPQPRGWLPRRTVGGPERQGQPRGDDPPLGRVAARLIEHQRDACPGSRCEVRGDEGQRLTAKLRMHRRQEQPGALAGTGPHEGLDGAPLRAGLDRGDGPVTDRGPDLVRAMAVEAAAAASPAAKGCLQAAWAAGSCGTWAGRGPCRQWRRFGSESQPRWGEPGRPRSSLIQAAPLPPRHCPPAAGNSCSAWRRRACGSLVSKGG
jgi:hypothetical protein